ncbi:MAG: hypothetical protein ACE5Q3_01580 [Alphaproteobacteria bacterium]
MTDVHTIAGPADEILAKGFIAADDVLKLRRDVFGDDGVVDRGEAEMLFLLDRAIADKAPEWYEFYVDSLTDYFVWKTEPRGYVSEEQADFLIENIVHDGRIDGLSELELLANIVHWAASCPERLVLFVLEAVRESVLTPDAAAYGKGRKPGVITDTDVELVRRVLYGQGSFGGFTVTRREAELLFALNEATPEVDNSPHWRDLFMRAVANYLMFPRSAPEVPSAAAMREREAWEPQRRGVGRLLREMGKAGLNFSDSWREADLFGARRAREEAEREAARRHEAIARQSIDEGEARWLLDRLGDKVELSENERALLRFIKEDAPHIHPSLGGLFERAAV